jgi:hypothetical protein
MRTLIKLAIRLTIIFVSFQLLIFFANNLANFVSFLNFQPDLSVYLSASILAVIIIVIATILSMAWMKSDWLVKKIAGDIDDNKIAITTGNVDLINVIMRVVGMVLILISIPKLAGLIVYRGFLVTIYRDVLLATNSSLGATEIKEWITVVGTLLIGLWLVLAGTGIFKFFNKVWNYIKVPE